MADIFVSYAREDRPKAEAVARLLEQSGWSVWWDRQLQPRTEATFDSVIDQELARSRCVLILWSRHSITSPWTKAEAIEGLEAGKLVQARLEEIRAPLPFRAFHSASLVGWSGRGDDDEFQSIRAAIVHYAPGNNILALEEAKSVIAEVARARRTAVGNVETAPDSMVGTKAFRARANDGKGVIYCHASGFLRGRAFYVRKGIGYVYEYLLGGSTCSLGLPTSNEEMVDGRGYPTSYFEKGYIEWSPKTAVVRALLSDPSGEKVILEIEL